MALYVCDDLLFLLRLCLIFKIPMTKEKRKRFGFVRRSSCPKCIVSHNRLYVEHLQISEELYI